MERRKTSKRRDDEGGGLYFSRPSKSYKFIHSGSTLLDLVIGGGWPLGRTSNIIGDNSTGKTLLAIEACANFHRQFPKGKIWYRETEAAFDPEYAQALGLPLTRIDFGQQGIETQWDTIEDIFEDISECVKQDKPGLYIVDSLDALSDRAEQKRGIDEGSYAMGKQKKLHELFRKRTRGIKSSNMHLMIISQTRVKIGVMFGEKTTCNGDGSLSFYASQRLKLAKVKTLSVLKHGQKQVTGVRIRAKCTKNKIASPHRECEFDIRFGFGLNDAAASLEFLITYGLTQETLDLSIKDANKLLTYLEKLDKKAYDEWAEPISDAVKKSWPGLQAETLPKWRKYPDET